MIITATNYTATTAYIDDEIQTTTCLGNNMSAKCNSSIHQRPRINTIAPLDQFQRIQISAKLKQ